MIICRVCFDNSEKLIPLTSDNIDVLSIVHMLNEFTIVNAEQHLPKYICEACAGQLDIAYAFKRKYEDSIVKFIRQTYGEETEETTGESSETNSQNEDPFDSKPIATTHMDYPEDSSADHKVLEEHQAVQEPRYNQQNIIIHSVKSHLMPERLHSEEIGSETEPELAGNIDTNPDWNVNVLIDNDLSDEPVQEVLEGHQAVQEHHANQQKIYIQNVESYHLLDGFNNGKPDDGLLNPNLCGNKIEKENKPHTESQQCENLDRSKSSLPNSKEAVEMDLKSTTAESSWQVLRSGFNRSRLNGFQEVVLPSAVLNKIYTYHIGHVRKPFKCDVCCRWFRTKGHIKTHRLRHIEGQKRIKCSKCLLTFLTKPHFSNHRCSIK